jgi:2-methylcitrate dehydratase PrpD
MTVLSRIGDWVAASATAPLSEPTRQRLSIHLLDSIGAWIAGRMSEEGLMLAGLRSPGPDAFPLLNTDPLDLSVLRVATIRLTEIDDIHLPSCTTPGSVVVPTALTIAASLKRPLSANAFAQALRVGYELMTRFGVAVDGPSILYRGIWPTYFTAPVCSAGITAQLLGLDGAQTCNAIGLALALTSGAPGTPTAPSPRWLLLGLAVRSGCTAALAAAAGYVADQKLLDGDWMSRTHGISCDTAPLLPDLQEDGAVSTLSLKPHCAAKQTIAAIEALRNLFNQGISPDDIVSLRVAVPPAYSGMIGHDQAAASRSGRITSAKYNLALAAYRPDGWNDIARPNLTEDSQISSFVRRVEVVPDESLSQYYPKHWPARVEAILRSGRSVSNLVIDAPGDPGCAYDVDAARAKFHRFVDLLIGESTANELARCCLAAIEHDSALKELCTRFVGNNEFLQ